MKKYLRVIKKRLFKPKNPVLLITSGRLSVGKMSFHNGNFIVKGSQCVSIGNYCAIGVNVKIITSNHDYNCPCIQGTFYRHYFNSQHPGEILDPPNFERTRGGVKIGSDVWIADDATILSGVSIGDGVCIAGSAVVTKDVPDYAIVGGVPAKVIKYRYSEETVAFLQKQKWWDWTEKKIINNKDFFETNINECNIDMIVIK
jgi:acetyltransferase-like isoleucine patch superfamily enzyme